MTVQCNAMQSHSACVVDAWSNVCGKEVMVECVEKLASLFCIWFDEEVCLLIQPSFLCDYLSEVGEFARADLGWGGEMGEFARADLGWGGEVGEFARADLGWGGLLFLLLI